MEIERFVNAINALDKNVETFCWNNCFVLSLLLSQRSRESMKTSLLDDDTFLSAGHKKVIESFIYLDPNLLKTNYKHLENLHGVTLPRQLLHAFLHHMRGILPNCVETELCEHTLYSRELHNFGDIKTNTNDVIIIKIVDRPFGFGVKLKENFMIKKEIKIGKSLYILDSFACKSETNSDLDLCGITINNNLYILNNVNGKWTLAKGDWVTKFINNAFLFEKKYTFLTKVSQLIYVKRQQPKKVFLVSDPKKNNICERVITLPQFTGTCWFNATLMCALFSQRCRNLLVYKFNNKRQKISDNLSTVIYQLLTNNYYTYTEKNKKEIYRLFKALTPEVILHKIHKHDSIVFNFDPEKYSGFTSTNYLPNFLGYLGIENILLLDLHITNLYISNVNDTQFMSIDEDRKGMLKNIGMDAKRKSKIPYNINNRTLQNDYEVVLIYYKPNNYGLDDTKLIADDFEMEEEIMLGDNHYVLDSVYTHNFNEYLLGGHAICGITCNNTRYVYNGWTRSTADHVNPDLLDMKNDMYPCELMKYDWFNNKHDFCLSNTSCKLDRIFHKDINPLKLCFNFYKSANTIFVYIKKDIPTQNFASQGIQNKIRNKDVLKTLNIDQKSKFVQQYTPSSYGSSSFKSIPSSHRSSQSFMSIPSHISQQSSNKFETPLLLPESPPHPKKASPIIEFPETPSIRSTRTKTKSPIGSNDSPPLSIRIKPPKKASPIIEFPETPSIRSTRTKTKSPIGSNDSPPLSIRIPKKATPIQYPETPMSTPMSITPPSTPSKKMKKKKLRSTSLERQSESQIKHCPKDKVRNPRTNRCVLKSGKIGQEIVSELHQYEKVSSDNKTSKRKSKHDDDSHRCQREKILNPRTNRCVLKTGKIGREIIAGLI